MHWYAKANNKYLKGYNWNKGSSYGMYWDANSLCGEVNVLKIICRQFQIKKDTSNVDECFKKKL